MLNIFGRSVSHKKSASQYAFREPTLNPLREPVNPRPAERSFGTKIPNDAEAIAPETDIPADYAGIVAYFARAVAERKSPFNALVQTADRLKEFIPDEIGRLRAAYALCGDQWPPEVLTMAINNHIADIDRLRERAKDVQGTQNFDQLRRTQEKIEQLERSKSRIQQNIDVLMVDLQQQQEQLEGVARECTDLQNRLAGLNGVSVSGGFLDQAAENLKNDLLAKKILLGLG